MHVVACTPTANTVPPAADEPNQQKNAGQICTAPDHVLVWPEIKDKLVADLVQAVHDFYGEDPQQSADYGRIIRSSASSRTARA